MTTYYYYSGVPLIQPNDVSDVVSGMPVVGTRTLLSIDRYARIMGINPLFFNQGGQVNTPSGVTVFPHGSGMPNVNLTWQQHSWNITDNVSREQVAQEIRGAEHDAASFLGYLPAPAWIEEEIVDMPKHYDPKVGPAIYDLRGDRSSVRLARRKFINGGVRAVDFIENATIEYVDLDGDSWAETAVVKLPYAMVADTDIREIKVYLPGNSGNALYEIRPPRVKYIKDGELVIHFYAWQLIKPELKHAFPNNDSNSIAIDISDPSYLLETVDVYREYNDESQYHFMFIYENGSYEDVGRLILKSAKADFVTLMPSHWDSDKQAWINEYAPDVGCASGTPIMARLRYYSGNRCAAADNTFDDNLDPVLAKAIALIATARLERPLEGNANTTSYSKKLQTDMSVGGGAEKTYRMFDNIIYNNPFGTRYGELLGYKALVQFQRKW